MRDTRVDFDLGYNDLQNWMDQRSAAPSAEQTDNLVAWFCSNLLRAHRGDEWCQYDLGVAYMTGEDVVPLDPVSGVKWLMRAANQGHPGAQVFVADLFYRGEHGWPKSNVFTFMWSALAALQDDPDGVELRDEVAAQLTPDELAEAERKVREWKPAAEW